MAGVTSDITVSGKIIVDEPLRRPMPTMTATSTAPSPPVRPLRHPQRRDDRRHPDRARRHDHRRRQQQRRHFLGGPLTGNFRHDGGTNILGNNSTIGVRLSDVSGNTSLAGSITARGQGAIAQSTGNIGGAMVLQARSPPPAIASPRRPATPASSTRTTYSRVGPRCRSKAMSPRASSLPCRPRTTARPTPTKMTTALRTPRKAARRSSLSDRRRHCGSAPPEPIAIGATENTGTGFGLIVDGGMLGDGLYTGVDGNGLQIGGLGGTVSIANGIGVGATG